MNSTPEDLELDLLHASGDKLGSGDVAGARKELLAYLDATDRRPIKLLGNLLASFVGRGDVPAETSRRYADASLAVIEEDPQMSFHEVFFIVNLAQVLTDQKRYSEAVGLGERALARGYFSAEIYGCLARAATLSGDPKLLARSVKKLDKLTQASPKRISEKLGTVTRVFAEAALVHMLLGQKDEVLRYLRLAPEFRDPDFDRIKDAPAYASLEGDPAFAGLFAYPVVVRCKPASEPSFWTDGHRVFVDYAWPKDVKKSSAKIKEWLHELAPSEALRLGLVKGDADLAAFREAYAAELRAHQATLERLAQEKELTLVHDGSEPGGLAAEVVAEEVGRRVSRT